MIDISEIEGFDIDYLDKINHWVWPVEYSFSYVLYSVTRGSYSQWRGQSRESENSWIHKYWHWTSKSMSVSSVIYILVRLCVLFLKASSSLFISLITLLQQRNGRVDVDKITEQYEVMQFETPELNVFEVK